MITVFPIASLSDNYIWAITNKHQSHFAIVDPGDASPVLKFLQEKNASLACILITHHHGDHVAGINELLAIYPETPVYGPAKEYIPHCTTKLEDNDTVAIPEIETFFQVLFIPGHTGGHIGYYQENIFFCGDTVFANGCGRVFDSQPSTLSHSLDRISKLPPQTLLYCAHEYTLDNIGFAKWVEPDNQDLLQRENDTHTLIDNDQPSVPSTLELELKTNPFLRCHRSNIIEIAEKIAQKKLKSNAEVFTVLRKWKDSQYD